MWLQISLRLFGFMGLNCFNLLHNVNAHSEDARFYAFGNVRWNRFHFFSEKIPL